MKTNFLLPNYWKKWGWALLIVYIIGLSFIFGAYGENIWNILSNIKNSILSYKTAATKSIAMRAAAPNYISACILCSAKSAIESNSSDIFNKLLLVISRIKTQISNKYILRYNYLKYSLGKELCYEK
jgi:hypothetical protein